MLCQTKSERGQITLSDEPLGKGGEGSVYAVRNHSLARLDHAQNLVAKVYHQPHDGDRAKKIQAMINNPPHSDSVAWPVGVVFDNQKNFVGYVMAKLPEENYRTWAELSHAKQRKNTSSDFDVKYAITAIRNLGVALESIHQAGHCVGDVNESNIFIDSTARIMLVDTDSAQIRGSDGSLFPCRVGKPEYTAAEISHGPLAEQTRTPATDIFAYCVAVFQMLTGGSHPTDATFRGDGEPPSTIDKIRQNQYPELMPESVPPDIQRPNRVPTPAIPRVFKNILKKGLSADSSERPSLAAILKAEDGVLQNMTQCNREKRHWFDSREQQSCGWCAYFAYQSVPDPWSVTSPVQHSGKTQTSLPEVSFNNAQSSPASAPRRSTPTPRTNTTPSPPQQPSLKQSSGLPSGFYATPSTPQPPTPQPQSSQVPPKKIRGKSVISYADGSYEKRPSLRTLMRQDRKLALHSVLNEIPDILKFWWEYDRPVAPIVGTIIGFVMGMLLTAGWFFVPPMVVNHMHHTATALHVTTVVAMSAAASSLIFSSILLGSTIVDKHQAQKALAPGHEMRQDTVAKTITQFGMVATFFGPLFIVVITITALFAILRFAVAVIRFESRQARR